MPAPRWQAGWDKGKTNLQGAQEKRGEWKQKGRQSLNGGCALEHGTSCQEETRTWARPPAAGHWSQDGAKTPEQRHPGTRGSRTATLASASPERLGGPQLQRDGNDDLRLHSGTGALPSRTQHHQAHLSSSRCSTAQSPHSPAPAVSLAASGDCAQSLPPCGQRGERKIEARGPSADALAGETTKFLKR